MKFSFFYPGLLFLYSFFVVFLACFLVFYVRVQPQNKASGTTAIVFESRVKCEKESYNLLYSIELKTLSLSLSR